MIRVLHSVSNMDRGGIETMLMNFYRNVDRSAVQFDFLANKPKPGDYDEEIRALGGRIFVSPGYLNWKKYLDFMAGLVREHPEYRIIHTHNDALMIYALRAARKNGIPVRIAHAHTTSVPPGLKNEVKKILLPRIKYEATDYWGCSDAAGRFVFSEKRWEGGHQLIHNAINVDVFRFDPAKREIIRAEYGFGDRLVIGHVGRMWPQKNQKKLLEVFAEVHRRNPGARLVIIGTGQLEAELREYAKKLGVSESVTFTGVLSNVSDWYSAFDVFVMTSLYEGLPVVGVEAQASGLPCVFSDTITAEVRITDNVRFVPLDGSAALWAETILGFQSEARVSRADELRKAGYDIRYEAERMQNLYLNLYSSHLD